MPDKKKKKKRFSINTEVISPIMLLFGAKINNYRIYRLKISARIKRIEKTTSSPFSLAPKPSATPPIKMPKSKARFLKHACRYYTYHLEQSLQA